MKTTSLLPMSKAFASRLKSSATLFGETAGRTLQGYEVMNMIVRRVGEQVVLPGRSAEDVYGEGESRTARDRYSGWTKEISLGRSPSSSASLEWQPKPNKNGEPPPTGSSQSFC